MLFGSNFYDGLYGLQDIGQSFRSTQIRNDRGTSQPLPRRTTSIPAATCLHCLAVVTASDLGACLLLATMTTQTPTLAARHLLVQAYVLLRAALPSRGDGEASSEAGGGGAPGPSNMWHFEAYLHVRNPPPLPGGNLLRTEACLKPLQLQYAALGSKCFRYVTFSFRLAWLLKGTKTMFCSRPALLHMSSLSSCIRNGRHNMINVLWRACKMQQV